MVFSLSRRVSTGTNTTRVNDHDHGHGHGHDPTNVPGETTDGSGALYPAKTQRQVEQQGDLATPTAFGDKSPGVRRIEIIGQFFTGWHKIFLFFAIFLVSYVYGLDGTTRYTFQNRALSVSFGQSAQISTVTVVRSIVAAAAQPAYAKISDYFGRISILLISALFYVVGTVVQAAAPDLSAFLGGATLYQFGFTGVQLLVVVLIADLTSLRNRVFFSYVPAMPSLINTWVAGELAQAVIDTTTWRWGVGMFAIIFPAIGLLLCYSLVSAEVRANKAGMLADIPSPVRALRSGGLWKDFFWQIDLIGLLLIAAIFAFILVPLTLAGGDGNQWATANIIVPLVIGVVVCIPAFVLWEMKMARHPVMPFRILKDRQVIAALSVALLLNTAWYTQGDYLYYTLRVAFNQTIRRATWIQNIYTFVSVVIGCLVGLAVRYVRRLKYFAVAGTLLFVLAFGLLYRYRGGVETHELAGLVGAEVILGVAGGLFPYPVQALIQASVQHERTATVTALYLASYSIGSALGNTIAGGIWINTLPDHLLSRLEEAGVANAAEIASSVYADPETFIESAEGAIGTPAREAVMAAYGEVQRYLTITGLCISVLLVVASLCLRNPRLGDQQSLQDAEGVEVRSIDSDDTKTAHQPGSPQEAGLGRQAGADGLTTEEERAEKTPAAAATASQARGY